MKCAHCKDRIWFWQGYGIVRNGKIGRVSIVHGKCLKDWQGEC